MLDNEEKKERYVINDYLLVRFEIILLLGNDKSRKVLRIFYDRRSIFVIGIWYASDLVLNLKVINLNSFKNSFWMKPCQPAMFVFVGNKG